ncbi:MAG: endonuclease/exonuclease/phosphatase family protein [Planctomycetota bacterium]
MIRTIPRALLVVVSILVGVAGSYAQSPIRVMSFNIRYGAANDGENHWKHRKEMVADVIRDFAPDVLGVQEALGFQSEFLRDQLDGYSYFGRSRMTTPNEHCGIFFNSQRFVQLAGGHFWLSENPEVPASKSWDSSLPRMATWLLLQDVDGGSPVLMVNTHFDHRGREARQRSAELLARRVVKLRGLADAPRIIVTGDFNTGEGTGPHMALVGETLQDSLRAKHPEATANEGTFNGWQGKSDGARIDWILFAGEQIVDSAQIIRTNVKGRYPSDHFPVTAVLAPETQASSGPDESNR